MTMTETARPLKNNTYVVTSNRGVDEYGMYYEFVQLDSTLSIIGYYCRVFVAGRHVSFYERKAQTARTTWKPFTKSTPEAAREWALKLLKRGAGHNVMRGSPLLVQLEPADIDTMDKGKSPGARYRAQARHEQLFGKLEVNADAKPGNMDFSGTALAIEAIGTPNTAVMPTATPAAATIGPSPFEVVGGTPGAAEAVWPEPPEPEANPDKSTPLGAPIDWTEVTEPY